MLAQTLNPTQKKYSSTDEYMRELREEVVETSGKATDGYHMGKLMYHVLKKHPQAINQIDAISGEVETNESVLRRTVRLATALTDRGLKVGDVVAVMGPHHLDLCIPVFAAHFIGAAILPLPESSTSDELKNYLGLSESKIVFSQSEHVAKLKPLQNDFTFEIVTFDESEKYQTMYQFIEQHTSGKKLLDFSVSDLNPYETTAWLMTTSGTTGLPNIIMVTHANVAYQQAPIWKYDCDILPPVTKLFLILSPLQWQAAMILYISGVIFATPRVQTSEKLTTELVIDIINGHKPSLAILSPTLNRMILESPKKCDFSCFKSWWIGGSHMHGGEEITGERMELKKWTYHNCAAGGVSS